MNRSLQNKQIYLAFGLPLLIFGLMFLLTWQSFYQVNSQLFIAITYDLTITAPLLYFLMIRKTAIPNLTVVPVFLLGLLIGNLILPEAHQQHLDGMMTYVFPLFELFVVGTIVYKSSQVVKNFKGHPAKDDFYARALMATKATIGDHKIAHLLAFEISAFYYAFFVWKHKTLASNQYTSYKRNGIGAMFWAVIMILSIETVAVHLLLERWSPLVAWLLTLGSLYMNLQIFAHLKALKQRYTTLLPDQLMIRNGLLGACEIPLDLIERVELSRKEIKDDERIVHKATVLENLESHNLCLYLKEQQQLRLPYGKEIPYDVLCVFIDEKDCFYNDLRLAMEARSSEKQD